MHQDIRPIRILILNLMPLKEETELQLLRSLSNTPLGGACNFYGGKKPCVKKYIHQPFE